MSRIAMRTRPPMKMCGRKPITVLWRGRSGGGMCSCSWSRSWLCSGMHTSLLRKSVDRLPRRKISCCREELRCDRQLELNGPVGVWRHLSCGVRIGGLWHDLGLPGFDEDDGGDQDYQYGYKKADDN